MVRGISKIIIIGNLGGDPEMRYTPNGDAVSNFSVAVNRRYRSRDGETQEATEWFRVSAWGRMAEVSNQYLTKGSAVYVEGRFSTRRWTGQDDLALGDGLGRTGWSERTARLTPTR
jgi:single-strand DNA-binding protein